jgi:hypothetical protein
VGVRPDWAGPLIASHYKRRVANRTSATQQDHAANREKGGKSIPSEPIFFGTLESAIALQLFNNRQ